MYNSINSLSFFGKKTGSCLRDNYVVYKLIICMQNIINNVLLIND